MPPPGLRAIRTSPALAPYLLLAAVLLPSVLFADTALEDGASETVVLLHGLGRTSRSFNAIAEFLEGAGYRAVSIDYPSTSLPIDALAGRLGEALVACCRDTPAPVHFVTHSLGGVLLRHYVATRDFDRLGRVVMLSPPSTGSELVDVLRDNPLYQFVTGPAGQQLGTNAESAPNALPPVTFELGVITGDRTLNPLYSWLIPGADDGKVSVERARAEGMADFLVVPHSHTFIMSRPAVMRATRYFLEHGRFPD